MDEKIKMYFIRKGTMALLPVFLEDGKIGTKVLEEGRELVVHCKPTYIVTASCIYYGASYKGRRDATKELIQVNRKPPIAVNPYHEVYFFPSLSPTQEFCGWFSNAHIAHFKRMSYNQSEITFLNGEKILYNISKNTLEVQLSRTSILKSILSKRFAYSKKFPYELQH